jgi:hypothetical protein
MGLSLSRDSFHLCAADFLLPEPSCTTRWHFGLGTDCGWSIDAQLGRQARAPIFLPLIAHEEKHSYPTADAANKRFAIWQWCLR